MRTIRIIVLLALLSCVSVCLVGCVHPAIKKAQQTQFVKSICRQHTNVIMYVEYKNDRGTHVYLGLDHGNYSTRKAALRVAPNGTIWRKVRNRERMLVWEPVR